MLARDRNRYLAPAVTRLRDPSRLKALRASGFGEQFTGGFSYAGKEGKGPQRYHCLSDHDKTKVEPCIADRLFVSFHHHAENDAMVR